MSSPAVRLESYGRGPDNGSFTFSGFKREIVARSCDEVREAILAVDDAGREGLHAAGFVSYEAAPGLDSDLTVQTTSSDLPLVWFGLFEARSECRGLLAESRERHLSWTPSIDRHRYDRDLQTIRDYIEAGDTYQVNHTFRMDAPFEGDPLTLYSSLCHSQSANYCAFLDTGRYSIVSASPELFFALRNGRLTTRPMKGTHRRGRWSAEDEAFAEELRTSEKDRAENLMIVDLLRNDLGRVAQTGSVKVTDLWRVEPYETLYQMTSTVEAEVGTDTGVADLFEALFPCGSVTGAPKVRTMEIISEVEDSPRGVYTGAIGYVSPGNEAVFNVAIRTVCVDKVESRAVFGVGGGITWYSKTEDEYRECVTKAQVLTERRPQFNLFETALFDPEEGVFLRDRHLDRMRRSARYFGFPFDSASFYSALDEEARSLAEPARVRVVLSPDGSILCESGPLTGLSGYTAAVADTRVHSEDVFLYHKTTHRDVYEQAKSAHPEVDDVVLVNERGELTEFTIGNLVLKLGERLVTPAISCGLLSGTFRGDLLEQGQIEEQVLCVDDLQRAETVFMINSVRRWIPVTVVDTETEVAEHTCLTMGS